MGRTVLGELVLDSDRFVAVSAGHDIALTFLEFEILALLAAHPNVVIPRQRFVELIWEGHPSDTGRAIDIHITRLRKKLRGITSCRIETVRSRGYMLAVPDIATPIGAPMEV